MSLEELRRFAETSTAGGGTLQSFEHEGHKIEVVTRCFTSGVRSSDFGVYAPAADGRYHRVLYREPIWGAFFHAVQDGDVINVDLQPQSSGKGKPVFTFTISGCYEPQIK
ncbi:MAG TPA: hypothetical protein VFA15_04420 [Nitrososphaera sp.]|nr:hypothetical protein [Nitrososphaera sp.]